MAIIHFASLHVYVHTDSPWIVLEYLKNGDLGNFLKVMIH